MYREEKKLHVWFIFLQTTCTHELIKSKIFNFCSRQFFTTFPRVMYTSCFIPYVQKSLCLVFFLALSCIGGTQKTEKHTNFSNFLYKQLVRMNL